MSRKRHKPEEIVAKLRQVDVLTAQGTPVADAVRSIGVTEVTYYRWRQEYGGLKSDQVRRMKELETENQRLRKAVADLTLDKLICPSSGFLDRERGSGTEALAHLGWRLAACA
jgi:transposase-like protein